MQNNKFKQGFSMDKRLPEIQAHRWGFHIDDLPHNFEVLGVTGYTRHWKMRQASRRRNTMNEAVAEWYYLPTAEKTPQRAWQLCQDGRFHPQEILENMYKMFSSGSWTQACNSLGRRALKFEVG